METIQQIVLTREWQVSVSLAIAAWTIGATGAALLKRAGVNIPAPSVNLTFGIAFILFFIPLFLVPGEFLSQKSSLVLILSVPVFFIAGLFLLIFTVLKELLLIWNVLKDEQIESVGGVIVRLTVAILILANCYWLATLDG